MKVENLLRAKGEDVETASPDDRVVTAIHRLTTKGIGALVVSADGHHLQGVFSERDIVRGLTKHGAVALDMRVRDLMSRGGPVCSPSDSLKRVMAEMTRTRHRHLPVVDGGRLCGIVSIGDVVKHRLEEMELEASVLRDAYLTGR
ncbi:MAG: CBS domain-containing protein [Acidimicrobiales bacterium]